MSILLVFPLVLSHIAQPLLIRQIVLFIKGASGWPVYSAYLFGIALFISCILQAIVPQYIFFRNSRIGMRIRNALSSAIYKHLLAINTAALHNVTAAQMVNLVANDVSKFEEFSVFVHASVFVPVEAGAIFGLLWWYIGLPSLFGYGVLILLIPIQFIFSRQFSRYRKTTIVCTDRRVQAINELINGCQIIKIYSWEKAMKQRIRETRRQELSNIYKSSCLRALNTALSFATLPLISLATFGGSWLMGRTLLSEDIFSTLAFFVMVRVPMTITMPSAIEKFSEARVSAERIDQFMKLDVLSNQCERTTNENQDHAVVMEDASFSWKDTLSLFSVNLKIGKEKLVGVKGPTGAGKSSLLAAILGEINLVSGKLRLHVNSISYAPQSPWIFADTIRANILLGKAMNEERYKTVIKACCLHIDLQNFGSAGDLLMIGDKGVNLSGGQRARISLARALYADADLYLLDDPLAAVDPKVAKNIFEQCIGTHSLLRGKTRILVTHQTKFLVEADQLILITNGQIEELQTEEQGTIELPEETSDTDWTVHTAVTDLNPVVQNESAIDGATEWTIWLKLFTAPPLRLFGFLVMIILMIVNEAFYDFANVWLALWSDKDETNQRSTFYVYIYMGAIGCTLVLAIIRTGYVYYIILRGATEFHNRMLEGILYTSLRFFESNPSGRILNRASKDQQVLDQLLPLALVDTMQYLLMTLGSITIIGRTNPWVLFILIPLIPSVLWLRRFYIRSSRQLKRLESVTRSPIYTLFSSSIDGLTSIRAYDVREQFLDMFIERIDTNSRAYFIVSATGRWFGLRLDFIASLLTLVTALLAVALRHQIDPSAAALSITYCVSLTGLFQWAVRQSAEAENFMTSAERIHEYGQLVSESEQNNSESNALVRPAENWPSHGIIEFKDYTFRYRTELEPALKNLNLRIESKEKIGIIGRTGTLTQELTEKMTGCFVMTILQARESHRFFKHFFGLSISQRSVEPYLSTASISDVYHLIIFVLT